MRGETLQLLLEDLVPFRVPVLALLSERTEPVLLEVPAHLGFVVEIDFLVQSQLYFSVCEIALLGEFAEAVKQNVLAHLRLVLLVGDAFLGTPQGLSWAFIFLIFT